MFKKIFFKFVNSIFKILLPFMSNFFIKLKVNKRIADYLNEKKNFANNFYDFSKIISECLIENKIVALDVGAQGGFNSDQFFPKKYDKFFEPILVEPIKGEANKLKKENELVINNGLWSKKTTKKLYILGKRLGSSSMYEPDPELLNLHLIKEKDYKNYIVTDTAEVECDSLSNSLKKLKIENLDYLKVDTQGSELEILKGIGDYKPLMIKIEVQIMSMYKDVPAWSELLNYLYKINYIIIDWKTIGSHATRVPAEMDMIFIPNFNNSFGKDLIINQQEKFISIMLIFGQVKLLKLISQKFNFKFHHKIEQIQDRFYN